MLLVRKIALMLAFVFGTSVAASSVAIAVAPSAQAPHGAPVAAQAGEGGDVDCEERPEHPDCKEDDWE